MKRTVLLLACLLGVATSVFGQPYSGPPTLQAFAATGLSMPYTTGTVTVGGFQQVLVSGTIVLTDNQNDCYAPQFAACNIVYWPGSGSVLLSTTSPLVAFTLGNA